MKSKESDSVFGPSIFFNLRYVKGGFWVTTTSVYGVKKYTSLSICVLYFGEVGELPKEF